jgi:hypothetical protein
MTCKLWGHCKRCHAVKHRWRDLIATHREEVENSHTLANAKWMEWVNSWSNSFDAGPETGGAFHAAFEQELEVLITTQS